MNANLRPTPGPWLVHPERAWVSPAGNLEKPVCAVRHPAIDVSEDEALANAFLIAAAPDLLDACKTLVEWYDREEDHAIDFYARIKLCQSARDKAFAAIASATSGVA